tara:strand:- start:1552 stop:1746 length:195 start_codon:yes stop_codon:yes gene_type:complete
LGTAVVTIPSKRFGVGNSIHGGAPQKGSGLRCQSLLLGEGSRFDQGKALGGLSQKVLERFPLIA